jgi:hypothetical protein
LLAETPITGVTERKDAFAAFFSAPDGVLFHPEKTPRFAFVLKLPSGSLRKAPIFN